MGNLSPRRPAGLFLHTRGGKIKTFPPSNYSEPPPPNRGPSSWGPPGATVSAASSKSPIVQTRSAILTATAGVVRKAPSFAHGATYK
jgi:hypothetical protein